MGSDWRWYFRLRCRMIATATPLPEDGPTGIRVKLCERWRWHKGACR